MLPVYIRHQQQQQQPKKDHLNVSSTRLSSFSLILTSKAVKIFVWGGAGEVPPADQTSLLMIRVYYSENQS